MREAALEDLRREIGSALAAEGALGNDPSVGHGHDGGWDVLTAAFAPDGEVADAGLG